MGKRIILKTTLICFGTFLIVNSLLFLYIFKLYPLDLEEHISVVTAAVDIEEGTIIEKKHLMRKEIQQSASNSIIATEVGQIVGKKAARDITRNDYVRTNEIVAQEYWYEDDDRIIIIPVSIEDRLANLIKKGSYIDVRLKKDTSQTIETILYKVKVQDMLDETGTPLYSNSAVNSRISYMKLVLGEEDRQKIYSATAAGKLVFELYCDPAQKSEN